MAWCGLGSECSVFLLLGGPFYLCIEIMEAFVGIVFFFSRAL